MPASAWERRKSCTCRASPSCISSCAQQSVPDDFICIAGYGNGGPSYIPTQDAYAQGGYEPTWAFVSPDADRQLTGTLKRLLAT